MQRRESNNNSSPGTVRQENVFFYPCKKAKKWLTLKESDAFASKAEELFSFFFDDFFQHRNEGGRNFGEIDGAMYRDDERAPIFPRKSERNLEKRGDPRKFGSDGSVPWLSLKKFPPASTIILMKMAARDFQPPFFCKKKTKIVNDDDDESYKYGGERTNFFSTVFRSYKQFSFHCFRRIIRNRR